MDEIEKFKFMDSRSDWITIYHYKKPRPDNPERSKKLPTICRQL